MSYFQDAATTYKYTISRQSSAVGVAVGTGINDAAAAGNFSCVVDAPFDQKIADQLTTFGYTAAWKTNQWNVSWNLG